MADATWLSLAAGLLAAGWRFVRSALGRVAACLGWIWPRLGRRTRIALAIAAIVLAAAAYLWEWRETPYHWMDHQLGRRPLMAAKSWHYQLTNASVDGLSKSDADLLVIDFATERGKVPLTPAEVSRLKVKPDGQPRLAVAYLSIGEAEIWRWYWRADWQGDDMPGWQVAENCAWPGAHMVRFWHDGWRDIVYRGRRSYLQRIVEAGFDGIYLDRVDVWEHLVKERPTARQDMIDFVADLAREGRRRRPGFLVIAQNAEDLLDDRAYRNTIDGLGKEDWLYGHSGTGVRNPAGDIEWSRKRLKLLLDDCKPVFAVEYLPTTEAIERVGREMRALGVVPTFQHRTLDGTDPTGPNPPKTEVHGTPEWIETQCKDKPKW